MSESETTPVWKKLYHVISGSNTTVTADVVEEILELCKDKVVKGFLVYTPYTRKSFKSWKRHSGLKEIVEDDEMCNFLHVLSKELNLDANIAWTVMCNFLMFEYFGKIDELKSIIRYESNVRYLIDNVWYFYSADRMFLLKSLRHIFENVSNKTYKFHQQFNDFIKSVKMSVLWKNLLKMLDNLINELDHEKAQIVSRGVLKRWIHRNNREQIEVVTLLIHVIQFCDLDGSELEEVLTLFLRHGFTRHLLYQGSNVISRPKDIWEVKCSEIGCILAIMERYWQSPGTAKMISINVEKNLELLQIQGDNSIVLFAWAVLKTSISESEEAMEYCNRIITELLEKRVFNSLRHLTSHDIFNKCRSGDIVVEGVTRLMAEFLKICADYTYLHEQDGVCYVTAELLKRKGLVVLDNFGPIFQLSMDAFPFVFNPFLEMCKSMLAIPEQYNKIMRLLQQIPSFLSEISWNDHRDHFNLVSAQQLFVNSDLFVIPKGTLVEKFSYQGMDFARFMYPFSFFRLLEQFTKSLSLITFEVGKTWACYDNLTELVQIGFKFVIHILKHYKGDFNSDTVLKRLVQRLEIVPTQFCEGPMKNFNFIRLFFATNVTLITYNLSDFSQVFSPIVRRKFFPQVTNYTATNKELLNQSHYECLLFRSLKEEEGMRDHSLLVEYLKLVQYMVDNDLYQREVQMVGIWYVLNVVFPLHQQWPYDDEFQMMKICKLCITIFVNVLQRPEVDEGHKSYEIIKMCRDAFMFEELLMSSYLSVFSKDKFYIQNLMEQESNWTNGPILEQIENIRLQVVLLLLIYKIRSGIPATTKCTIDNKISIVTKAISSHMINPYNANLRLLAYRFLEILARDESIPLMALLALDYDQVQRLFLDKLRDPIEDDNVKMQILNLISTCIYSQHGMTAALFNVTRSRKWHSDFKEKYNEGDTVTDFMIDYLQNIKKSHEYLNSPLQVAILRVMANLWLSRKRHLIKDIVALDAFWPLLADPLFQEYKHLPSVYAHIFKILGTQLDGTFAEEKQIFPTVKKFLIDEKLMELWQKYLVKTFRNLQDIDIEEIEFLARSWMEFVLMTEKEKHLMNILSAKSKFLFIELCLDGIKFSFASTHCLEVWINMCIIFITHWGLQFKNKEAIIVQKAIQMFSVIKLHYANLNSQSRALILTIMQTVLDNLKEHFESNTADLLNFLEEIGSMIDYEYITLEGEIWPMFSEGGVCPRELLIPWMMCIHVANKLLAMKNISECSLWFSYRRYLHNLTKCICDLINNPETLPLTKIGLHSLELYAKSPLAFDFVNINMTSFYDSIESALTALFVDRSNMIHAGELEEGWVTCTLLMKFNQAFLQKFQYTALSTCYTYIKLHEQILQQIMIIPECTVSLKALDLLKNTLLFFNEMLINWQKEWYRKSNLTYNFILNCVKKVINSCLYIILRPKNIVVYSLDEHNKFNPIDKVPISLMVVVMNRLITIAGLCFSILYQANPNLIELMGVDIDEKVTISIRNDFSVPKFELPVPYELTYGKLLCLAHFMCKTLDALSCTTPEPVDDDVPNGYYDSCIGLVEHQDSSHNFPNQKLGAYLRYAMYEYSGLADPWIHKLDQRCVKKSLDLLMTFLSQQVFLFVRTDDVENLPYFKRNLASELQFYYEHIKKHTSLLFTDQIPTSVRTISTFKTDMDIIKRYLVYCRTNNTYHAIADDNFGLAIVHWFSNICQVH